MEDDHSDHGRHDVGPDGWLLGNGNIKINVGDDIIEAHLPQNDLEYYWLGGEKWPDGQEQNEHGVEEDSFEDSAVWLLCVA